MAFPQTHRHSHRNRFFHPLLNPTLPPGIIVSQIPPWNDLRGFGVSRFNLHPLNGIGRQVRRYHPADQKVLLFGQGLHSRPLGQQQFFGIQRVHGLCQFRGGFSFPAPPPRPAQSPPWRSSCSSLKRIKAFKITVLSTCRRVPDTVRCSFIQGGSSVLQRGHCTGQGARWPQN